MDDITQEKIDEKYIEDARHALDVAIDNCLTGDDRYNLTIELTLPSGHVIEWNSDIDDGLTNRQTQQAFIKAMDDVLEEMKWIVEPEDIKSVMGGEDE